MPGAGEVKVWDLESGREVWSERGFPHFRVSVAFSRDGKVLAAASGGPGQPQQISPQFNKTAEHLRLFDAATGRRLARVHTLGINALAFTADGKRLATAEVDGAVRLREVRSGREGLTFRGHSRGVASLAFSPDGNLLATGSGEIRIFDGTPDARNR
jgi:WD40 repeat protein